jgi:hypothetical protein
MATTIHAPSGHTLFIRPIKREDLPKNLEHSENYTHFWVVKNWDESGVVFFYIGQGHPLKRTEFVAWYRNGAFFTGCGKTKLEVISRAQKDGWMYA